LACMRSDPCASVFNTSNCSATLPLPCQFHAPSPAHRQVPSRPNLFPGRRGVLAISFPSMLAVTSYRLGIGRIFFDSQPSAPKRCADARNYGNRRKSAGSRRCARLPAAVDVHRRHTRESTDAITQTNLLLALSLAVTVSVDRSKRIRRGLFCALVPSALSTPLQPGRAVETP